MKWSVWLIVPLVVLALGAFVLFQFREVKGTFSTSNISVGLCQADDEIAPATRAEINNVATDFVELFARSPHDARQQMSRRGRAATMDRGAAQTAAVQYHAVNVISAPTVVETYFLRFSSGSESGLRIPCLFHGDGATFVARGGTPMSAVVLLTEDVSGGSQRTIVVWLEHEQGAWAVRAFQFGLSRIAGLDGAQLWTLARTQRARGHALNAYMLYVAARGALDRGSFYEPRIRSQFFADLNTFEPPEMLRGAAPFRWSFAGETYNVTYVQYTGFESGDVALIIDHAPPAWATNDEAEAINRRLIDGLVAAYPEWRETFDAIIARAAKPGTNQLWATVYMTDGYRAPNATEPK